MAPKVVEVSVVIPTRNRCEWLRLALRSALSQQGVDVEVIVVDDGSTDETGQMITDMDEPRVRLVRQVERTGVSAARNRGAAEAQGEWLAFLDDDDLWASNKLSRQLEAAAVAGRTWVYTGSVNADETLQVTGGEPPMPPEKVVKLVRRYNVLPGGGSYVIVRRSVFEHVGPFDPHLANGEDWEMWIRLAQQGLPAWVPEPLMAYRLHPENASLDVEAVWAGVAAIERRHRTKVDRGMIQRWIAESCLRTGRRSQALGYFALAAVHGQARGVVGDLLAVLQRRLDRRLGREPKELRQLPNPEWTLQAQKWLDEFAVAADPP
jgi:glycosyltransferase involved in cell wall biosynthesis